MGYTQNFTKVVIFRFNRVPCFFFPQRLGDLSALAVFKEGIHIKNRNLPEAIKSIMER